MGLNARFSRGSGAYKCRCCGRTTRDTGRGEDGTEMCIHCWESTGLENEMMDCGESPEILARWESLVSECEKLGGKPNRNMWWK
jgi:hypothetical protein